MEKASQLTCDLAVEKIMNNEFGILLIEADKQSFYDVLANQTSFEDRQGMHGNGTHITFHLFPIMYKNMNEKSTFAESRNSAIHNVFQRWTKLGYNKRNAKSPFSSKAFMKFLEDMEYLKADYMMFLVN